MNNSYKDEPFLWYPSTRLPRLKTDEDPALDMIIQIEDGYYAKGEYDHKEKTFLVYRERYEAFDDELKAGRNTAENIDQHLDWVPETTDEVRGWMWIPRPRF